MSFVDVIPEATWYCWDNFFSWRVGDGGQKLLGLDLFMPLADAAPAGGPAHQPHGLRPPASASVMGQALGVPTRSSLFEAFLYLSFVQKEWTFLVFLVVVVVFFMPVGGSEL